MGESNTVVSAYTLNRHIQQYCFHPSIYLHLFEPVNAVVGNRGYCDEHRSQPDCPEPRAILNTAHMVRFVLRRLENITRQWENAAFQYFLRFPPPPPPSKKKKKKIPQDCQKS